MSRASRFRSLAALSSATRCCVAVSSSTRRSACNRLRRCSVAIDAVATVRANPMKSMNRSETTSGSGCPPVTALARISAATT
jgi:hypothetical protein